MAIDVTQILADADYIADCARMQKVFCELYDNGGLISIDKSGVHLTTEAMAEMFPNAHKEPVTDGKSFNNWFYMVDEFNGVRFYSWNPPIDGNAEETK